MIRSMTAFARCQHSASWGTLTWEIRSVNHRYLDMNLRLPEDFRAAEGRYRELINAGVSRGKLECNLRFVPEKISAEGIEVDEEQAKALVKACQHINDMLHQPSEISAVEVLFILVEIVDWAAAKTPATTRPAMPIGSSRAMNSGKIASFLKVGSSRSGWCW